MPMLPFIRPIAVNRVDGGAERTFGRLSRERADGPIWMLDGGQLPRRPGVDRMSEIVDRPFAGRDPAGLAGICLALL